MLLSPCSGTTPCFRENLAETLRAIARPNRRRTNLLIQKMQTDSHLLGPVRICLMMKQSHAVLSHEAAEAPLPTPMLYRFSLRYKVARLMPSIFLARALSPCTSPKHPGIVE